MDPEAKVIEVSIFQGKLLVVFSDQTTASLDLNQLRSLAVELDVLTPSPKEEGFA
jgi:hypothetical protein